MKSILYFLAVVAVIGTLTAYTEAAPPRRRIRIIIIRVRRPRSIADESNIVEEDIVINPSDLTDDNLKLLNEMDIKDQYILQTDSDLNKNFVKGLYSGIDENSHHWPNLDGQQTGIDSTTTSSNSEHGHTQRPEEVKDD